MLSPPRRSRARAATPSTPTETEVILNGRGAVREATARLLSEGRAPEATDEEAASKITKAVKGKLARKQAEQVRVAAAKITAVAKGHIGRKVARAAKVELNAEQEEADAVAKAKEHRMAEVSAMGKRRSVQRQVDALASHSATGLGIRSNALALFNALTGTTRTKAMTPQETREFHTKLADRFRQPLSGDFTSQGRPAVRYNRAYYGALRQHLDSINQARKSVEAEDISKSTPVKARKAAEAEDIRSPPKAAGRRALEGHAGVYLNAAGRTVNERGQFVADPRKVKAQ